MVFKNLQGCHRGVHSLIAVSMLIGFSLVVAGMLFAVLVDYRDVSLSNAGCSISGVSLHDAGDGRAYLVASLYNLGSETMTSASITFADDSGIEHGFSSDSLAIDPGDAWDVMGSFPASISEKNYIIKSTLTTNDGSVTICSTLHDSYR